MAMNAIPTLSSKTGCTMPTIGFGTSQLGNCGEIVASALKLGYRNIDTAWKYGTEKGVGEGIKASGVARKDIFLVTKVSHEYLKADAFANSVEESLERLQTDYVDLLFVHWPAIDGTPLAETMGALAKAKRAGKARHIGVANFNIALLENAMRLCPEPLSALQAEYIRTSTSRRCSPSAARRDCCSWPTARSGAGDCSRTRSLPKSRKRKARHSRRSRCAGLSSRVASCRFRAQRTPNTWRRA